MSMFDPVEVVRDLNSKKNVTYLNEDDNLIYDTWDDLGGYYNTYESVFGSNDFYKCFYKGVEVESVDEFREDEYMHRIICIDDLYYRITTSYDSWNGVDWSYCKWGHVVPKTITKTIYTRA